MASLFWSKRTAGVVILNAGLFISAAVHAQDGGAAGAPVPDAAAPPTVDDAADAGGADATPPRGDASLAPEPAAEPVSEPAPELAPTPSSEPVVPASVPPPAVAPEPAQAAAPAIEVTVVGTKLSRVAGSAHVIRKKDLERFEYDDPHKILLSVPGVSIRGEDALGLRPNISIRGVDPDRSKKVTLLEDGILLGPAPYSAPAAYYFPLFTRMERVTVLKGPGTIVHGPQTVAGSIDLSTRSIPASTSGGADIAAGMFGYGKGHVHVGSSTEQVGFLIEGVRLQSNGFKELPGGGDTGFIRNEWMIKGSYVIDPRARIKNELKLKLTYSDEVSNETYLGLTDADFKKNPDQRYFATRLDRMENHRTSIVLGHVLTLSPKLSLTTQVYRHDFKRTWRRVKDLEGARLVSVLANPDQASYASYIDALHGVEGAEETILIGPNQRTFVSQGVESRLRWQGDTGPVSHRLEVGARYHNDSVDRRESQNGFVMDAGELVPDGEPTQVTDFNRAWTHAVALHASYALTWAGLTLTPGVRAELMRSGFYDRLNAARRHRFLGSVLPGVSAYYAITDELGLLGGVYRGFAPPMPNQDMKNKAEESLNYEAGARYTRGLMRLEAIGFYNDYRNLTDTFTSEATMDMQWDAGRARVYGLELGGEHELPAGPVKLPLRLAYTFTRSEYLERAVVSSGIAEPGDEVIYLPRHQLWASAGVEHARAGGNLAVMYIASAREVPSHEPIEQVQHTDAQFVMDASAYAKIWKTISIYATLQNLLDSRFIVSRRPFGARPNAPRWLQIGVKGSF